MIRKTNWYVAEDYASHLSRAGFTNISIKSIRDHVFQPYREYYARKIMNPALQLTGLRGFMLKQGRRQVAGRSQQSAVGYVIVMAEKPV